MRNFKQILILLTLFISIASCSKKEDVPNGLMDEHYIVKVDKIGLPVRVAGNKASKIAVIMVHGGPGNSSQTFRFTTGVRNLETFYKIIYYDQRSSGTTQGNTKPEDVYIEKYSEDLDAIVEFTKQIVGAETIFICGHSWGGGLSSYYLLDDKHQAKIKGYIPVCPAYNVTGGLEESRQWVINYAVAAIAANKNKDYWNRAIDFYAKTPKILAGDFLQHAAYLGKADGAIYNTAAKNPTSYVPAFESQAFIDNAFFTSENMKIGGVSIFEAMDLTSQINKIKIPVLLIWGSRDGLLPPGNVPGNTSNVALGPDMISNLGTPDADKSFLSYANSAHQPMSEEGVKFANDIRAFIEKYK
jgi:pimeloyl-ACP methyl ester carboxylesterase